LKRRPKLREGPIQPMVPSNGSIQQFHRLAAALQRQDPQASAPGKS
jgi:hypothetical protein